MSWVNYKSHQNLNLDLKLYRLSWQKFSSLQYWLYIQAIYTNKGMHVALWLLAIIVQVWNCHILRANSGGQVFWAWTVWWNWRNQLCQLAVALWAPQLLSSCIFAQNFLSMEPNETRICAFDYNCWWWTFLAVLSPEFGSNKILCVPMCIDTIFLLGQPDLWTNKSNGWRRCLPSPHLII